MRTCALAVAAALAADAADAALVQYSYSYEKAYPSGTPATYGQPFTIKDSFSFIIRTDLYDVAGATLYYGANIYYDLRGLGIIKNGVQTASLTGTWYNSPNPTPDDWLIDLFRFGGLYWNASGGTFTFDDQMNITSFSIGLGLDNPDWFNYTEKSACSSYNGISDIGYAYDPSRYIPCDKENLPQWTKTVRDVEPVPIPAAGLLLATALAGIGALSFRRRSA